MAEGYILDKDTVALIAGTAAKVDSLAETAKDTAAKVDRLTETVGDLKTDVAVCLAQKEDVETLKGDVKNLQTATTLISGKLAMIGIIAGTIAGWIGSVLPGLMGGRS